MPAQDKLSQTEQYFAYLAGLGIVIVIAALILLGLGTFDDNDVPVSLLLVGLAGLVIGIAGWLIMVQPWTTFDDLTTPLYTGHEEHASLTATEEGVPAELSLIPAEPAAIEPVPAAGPPMIPPEPVVITPAGAEAPGPQEDDLVMLEGIGPRSAAALRAAGITTFAQVAKMTPAELDQIMKAQGVRLVGTTQHWPRQAEIAASGDLTALDEFRRRLRGPVVENDLTLIEGIGLKSAAALKEAGITTFAQIAQMSPADLERIVRERKVRLVGSTATWPQQAALAAQGDLNELEALRLRIKRGGTMNV